MKKKFFARITAAALSTAMMVLCVPAIAADVTSDSDLAAKWTFDEESGKTVYDISGNGVDATINCDTYSRVQGASDTGSKAVRWHDYNAYSPVSEQRINVNDNKKLPNLLNGSSGITVMAMVKKNFSKTEDNSYHDLITLFCSDKGDLTKSNAAFRIYMSNAGIKFCGRSTYNDSFLNSGNALPPQYAYEMTDWNHVAVAVDYTAKTVKIYFNGTLAGEKTNLKFGSDTFNYVGTSNASARCHIGAHGITIDDMSVWKRALTEEEIRKDIPPVVKLDTSKITDDNGLTDINAGDNSAYLLRGKKAQLTDGVNGPAVKANDCFYLDANRLIKNSFGSSALAAGLWFKADPATKPYLWQMKIKNSQNSNTSNGFAARLTYDDSGTYFDVGGRSVGTDGWRNTKAYAADFDKDKWHHLFAVLDYSGKRILVYLDGELIKEQTGYTWGQTTLVHEVDTAAANRDSIAAANVEFSDFVFYNRFVYENEIKEIYNSRPFVSVAYKTDAGYIDAPLAAGTPVTVTATVNNTSDKAENIILLFARLNGGVLKEVKTVPLEATENNAQIIKTYNFDTVEPGDELCVFTWDDMGALRPWQKKIVDTEQRSEQKLLISSVFSDNMVVQRGKDFTVWGSGVNGTEVTVTFNGVTKTTPVNGKKWEVAFNNTDSLTDSTLTVTDGETTYSAADIKLGQVFVLAGQSNMEWSFRKFGFGVDGDDEDTEIDRPYPTPNENIVKFDTVIYDGKALAADDVLCGRWEKASTANINSFSYLGYTWADKLQKELGEPVGIIQTAVGGTQISCWMTRNSFESVATTGGTTVNNHSDVTTLYRHASGLYNTKINPIGGYSVNGVLWYQGEADYNYADYWYAAFDKMINDWRNLWSERTGADEKLPFFVVQLPRYKADYAAIREAQWFAQFKNDNVTTVTSIDSGDKTNIHPLDKTAVADRLFGAVMTKIYGRDTVYMPAVYESSTTADNKMTLKFTGAGSGLKMTEDAASLTGFEITADGETWVEANAEITGTDTISVYAESITAPTAVRYAWSAFPDVSVCNSDNIPLVPFRTNSPYLN